MKTDPNPLFQRYLDGRITGAEMTELNELLEHNESVRSDFVDWLNLDAALAAMSRGWEAAEEIRPRVFRPFWKSRLALAASVVLAAGLLWFWQDANRACAVVAERAGADGLEGGTRVRGERFELAEGTVKLLTRRGAELVIEAPAVFRFESPQRLRLEKGRLAAEVPPAAKGFTVVTPDGNAVDLGTRFGVDVPAEGDSEIHVFEGEVIATGAGGDRSLRGGDALVMSRGNGDARELRSAAFIQADELPALDAGLAAGQQARSRLATEALKSDPALIALIDFDTGPRRPGVYRLVQGRWPGSRAAEFVEVGDHLRLQIGGDQSWPQLTLAAWVRLDHLGAPYQSLLHTDGWSENNSGQVHWMINGNATMRLALRENVLAAGSEEKNGYPDSSIPVLTEQGRWVHLAVVYDSEKGTVRFYLNGRFDRETRQSFAHPARLGPAQIGNWHQQDRKLSGRIDQLLVLGRAMSDAEMVELHEAGTPYR